jgi:riboflavin synthase
VVRFTLDPEVAALVTRKGSIAIDGISLTVSAVGDDWFEVSLIPETLTATTLGTRVVGDAVNVETDILARQVQRLLFLGAEDDRPASSISAPHRQTIGFSAVSTTASNERSES